MSWSLLLCKSDPVCHMSSAVLWPASSCRTGGLMVLCHTLPPGSTHHQPQLADLLSHSICAVNIGHTPVPAVSACQPASLWASPDASSSPFLLESLPHLSTSTSVSTGGWTHRGQTLQSETNSKNSVWLFRLNAVRMCTVLLLRSCVHVDVFAWVQMPKGAAGISQPSILPTAICNSNEHVWGIQWGWSSPPLLCVSLEEIISRTCELTQPFLIDFSVGKSKLLAVPLYEAVSQSKNVFRGEAYSSHSILDILLLLAQA